MNQSSIFKLEPLGDSAVVITLGEGIHLDVHRRVKSLSSLLDARPFAGFIESVPAYNTLTVYYSPAAVYQAAGCDVLPYEKVTGYIRSLAEFISNESAAAGKTVEIPVYYGGEYGPDLEEVAALNGLTPEEVIDIHSSGEYVVYMIGFAPGFPFLGGMDERIAAPRKQTPRTKIPAGSVGIAGRQTGIYPLETPGGWQIIGRTPQELFLPDQSPPSLLQAGDTIKFVPIHS